MISVIIPVYNVIHNLDECVQSIVGQTCQDWECVLVDDGSTDGSGRIRVIHKENGGVSSARNKGMEEAKGDYVKLLGFHTNPYKYIVQGDLFVCSSRSEGYSTAVTEALVLGVPVITTDCSGMAELLKDGECGMITENDDEAFYEGLKSLLNDAAMLEYYREKAVERGKDFTIESLSVALQM
jgi:glycosyltransferase involved in cell wall biosynthesis